MAIVIVMVEQSVGQIITVQDGAGRKKEISAGWGKGETAWQWQDKDFRECCPQCKHFITQSGAITTINFLEISRGKRSWTAPKKPLGLCFQGKYAQILVHSRRLNSVRCRDQKSF